MRADQKILAMRPRSDTDFSLARVAVRRKDIVHVVVAFAPFSYAGASAIHGTCIRHDPLNLTQSLSLTTIPLGIHQFSSDQRSLVGRG